MEYKEMKKLRKRHLIQIIDIQDRIISDQENRIRHLQNSVTEQQAEIIILKRGDKRNNN